METRESLGKTPREMASICGINYGTYLKVEGCKQYPSEKMARKISVSLGSDAEWLFPEALASISITCAVHKIDAPEFLSLDSAKNLAIEGPSLDDVENQRQEKKIIKSVMVESLTPRQQKILEMRFGMQSGEKMTLEAIGKEFGLSKDRIRQIEEHALRKLRNPSSANKLKGLL